MSEFQREHRYYVAKVRDVEKYLTDFEHAVLAGMLRKLSQGRVQDGKDPLICCVVEQDWPEYEPTWQAIEERVTGGTAGGARDMEVERLRGLILLQQAFDALEATTDSDIDFFEDEEEEAEAAPAQYACRKIMEAMDFLRG
jgi:hypothetical protein